MKLNADQTQAFQLLIDWCQSPDYTPFTLIGWAGRGKTTLMLYWLQMLDSHIRARVAVTAPTNRAVDVFRSKWPNNLRPPGFMTIHSFNGIREQIQSDGSLKFYPQPKDKPKVDEYDYLIVDEGSMVGQELLDITLQYRNKIKIIIVGDDRQVVPVGESECPALNIPGSIKCTLTTVVRQQEGSPILEAAERYPNYWDIKNTISPLGNVSVVHNHEVFENTIVALAKNEKIFEAGFLKVLAWRNRTVDKINELIRTAIFGQDIPRFIEGDRLITKGPCVIDDVIVAYASEELVINKIKVVLEPIAPEITYAVYQLYCTNSRNEQTLIRVIHECDELNLASLLKALSSVASQNVAKGMPPYLAWDTYYTLKEMFHNVQHGYALTVHRAQGGTYENVAVNISDINANRSADERKRLYYTAVTRASQNLILFYGNS